jgi:hypothetical protein
MNNDYDEGLAVIKLVTWCLIIAGLTLIGWSLLA